MLLFIPVIRRTVFDQTIVDFPLKKTLGKNRENVPYISVETSSCERPIFIIKQYTGEKQGNAIVGFALQYEVHTTHNPNVLVIV